MKDEDTKPQDSKEEKKPNPLDDAEDSNIRDVIQRSLRETEKQNKLLTRLLEYLENKDKEKQTL